jgi:glyceraldehyde-3-phosphate dehydrogenase (NAD(P))
VGRKNGSIGRIKSALMKGYNIYGYDEETSNNMNGAGIRTEGNLHDLLGKIDVVIDCSPKKIGAKNIEIYKEKKNPLHSPGRRKT